MNNNQNWLKNFTADKIEYIQGICFLLSLSSLPVKPNLHIA